MSKAERIEVTIEADAVEQIDQLRRSYAVGGTPKNPVSLQAVLNHLVQSVADGVRRPGSWERDVVERLFGAW